MFVSAENQRTIYSAESSEVGLFVGVTYNALPLSNLLTPWSMAYHTGQRMIYWSDHGYAHIYRANLDGSGKQTIVPSGLAVPIGVSIDEVRDRLYWVDAIYKRIESANLDGSDRTVIIDGLSYPHDIVIAPTQGLLFWPDRSDITIERANINGTDRMTLVNSGMLVPTGVALDHRETRVYWCDYQLGLIESVNFTGGDRTVHVSGVSGYFIRPWRLDTYGENDDVYFTDNVNLVIFGPNGNGQIGPITSRGKFAPPFDIFITPEPRDPATSSSPSPSTVTMTTEIGQNSSTSSNVTRIPSATLPYEGSGGAVFTPRTSIITTFVIATTVTITVPL